MTTKTFKTIAIVIVCICIAIVGYLMFQEVSNAQHSSVTQQEPTVTVINDSTYHINLSYKCCVTLEKDNDTLNIYQNGPLYIQPDRSNDTIHVIEYVGGDTIPAERLYTITYHDFFEDTFSHFSFK